MTLSVVVRVSAPAEGQVRLSPCPQGGASGARSNAGESHDAQRRASGVSRRAGKSPYARSGANGASSSACESRYARASAPARSATRKIPPVAR